MKTVEVDAKALSSVLTALIGPSYLIRELIVVSNLPGGDNAINLLVTQYNKAVEVYNLEEKEK